MTGLHVWYLTRPVFALVSSGWHIMVPLAPFVFDPDLYQVFPGSWINRRPVEQEDQDNPNSICMSDSIGSEAKEKDQDDNANNRSFENPLHQEYNQSVV